VDEEAEEAAIVELIETLPDQLNRRHFDEMLLDDFVHSKPPHLRPTTVTKDHDASTNPTTTDTSDETEAAVATKMFHEISSEIRQQTKRTSQVLQEMQKSNEGHVAQLTTLIQENASQTSELQNEIKAIRTQVAEAIERPAKASQQHEPRESINVLQQKVLNWQNEIRERLSIWQPKLEGQIAALETNLLRQVQRCLANEPQINLESNQDNQIVDQLHSIHDCVKQNQIDVRKLFDCNDKIVAQLVEQFDASRQNEANLNGCLKHLIDLSVQIDQTIHRSDEQMCSYLPQMQSMSDKLHRIDERIKDRKITARFDKQTQCDECESSEIDNRSIEPDKEIEQTLNKNALETAENGDDSIEAELRDISRQSRQALQTYLNKIRWVQSNFGLSSDGMSKPTKVKDRLVDQLNHFGRIQVDDIRLPFAESIDVSNRNQDEELHQLARLQSIRKAVNRKMIRLDRVLWKNRLNK
jgi:hypothetical protein